MGVVQMNGRGWIAGAVMSLALAGSATPLSSAEIEHRTDYSIRLSGLPVATATFRSAFRGDRYTISGSMQSAGLADIFSSIKGTTSVSGVVSRGRLHATNYSVNYKSGKRGRAIDVTFRNGNVITASMVPPRRKPKNWVPVSNADMRAVLDPISGLIIPEGSRICPKTLPIFDGESRMDLKLTSKGTKPYSTKGFEGEVVVCGIRFVPKSGYRKGRDDVEYLRKLSTMEIWFAKADGAKVYAPVYVQIPTKLGPVTVSATRFGG
ncbi:DUF3108 domain-containing protein [Shinella kummerowiae]|jgi:hypothetical protein|uniref:DUF3108 domain-containing protein n=2 Tax=Shinella kummerowiae TaxID=417745 RepID=A0A6N8SNL3_9HYPH|nr:DUF3108 domain-containing protein [Shinella kummerowiae]MCT7667608.1 DUF3108 domain-containing protein [Shinella kummerowiae]MXN48836.1 DUF3108 domain-containing protein [Shinella kummerowiae]